jgi:hypothetical protein
MPAETPLPPLAEMARDFTIGADPKRTGLKPRETVGIPREQFLALLDAAANLPDPSAELVAAIAAGQAVPLTASVVAVPSGAQWTLAKAVAAAFPVE